MNPDLRLGVKITGDSSDLLRAYALATGAHKVFKREVQQGGRSLRSVEMDARRLNDALRDQRRALQGLTLDYVAVRRAILTLGIRAGVTGFASLTSAISALGTTLTAVTASLAQFGGALATVAASGLGALAQGALVAKLGLEGVGKALNTAGKDHEKALAKLSKPQRALAKELGALRDAWREIKLLAADGISPGIVRGLKAAQDVMGPLKQATWDTARVWGYLADQMGRVLGGRSADIDRLLQRNVVTLRRFGTAGINAFTGFIDIFRAADPLIGHVTRRIVTLSRQFREAMSAKRADGGLASFFFDLRKNLDSWTAIIADTGRLIFGLFSAIEPVVDRVTNSIKRSMDSAADWMGSKEGRAETLRFFERMEPVMGSFMDLLGAIAKTWARLSVAGADNAVRIFDGLRTHVLPLLEQIALGLNDHILPAVLDLGRELVEFAQIARPALEVVAGVVGKIVEAFAQLLEAFNSLTRGIGGLGGGFLALAVGGVVLRGWERLLTIANILLLKFRQLVGLAPSMASIMSGAAAATAAPVIGAGGGGGRGARPLGGAGGGGSIVARGPFGGPRSQPSARTYTAALSGGDGFSLLRTVPAYGQRIANEMAKIHTLTEDAKGNMQRLVSAIKVPAGVSRFASVGVGVQQMQRMAFGPDGRLYEANPNQLKGASGRARRRVIFPPAPIGLTAGDPLTGATGGGTMHQRSSALWGSRRVRSSPGRFALVNAAVANSMRGAANSVSQAVVSGARKAAPAVGGLLKGTIGLAAIGGIIGGIAGRKHELGKSLSGMFQNAMEAATFGAIEGTETKSNRLTAEAADALRRGGRFKGFGSDLSTAQGVQEFRTSYLRALRDGKDITDAQFRELDRMAEDIARKLSGVQRGRTKLGEGFGFNPSDLKDGVKGIDFLISKFREARGEVPRNMRQVEKGVRERMRLIRKYMKDDSASAKRWISLNFQEAASAIKAAMAAGLIETEKGLRQIERMFARMYKEYGFSDYQANREARRVSKNAPVGSGRMDGGKDEGIMNWSNARGGINRVGYAGQSGTDKRRVSMVVGDGEDIVVFNRHQRRIVDERLADMGGVRGLFGRVNQEHSKPKAGLNQRFARGGMVTGDTDYTPAMHRALTKMAIEAGRSIYVQSGRRTRAEQEYLYRTKGPGMAARPGSSRHETGLAADITPGREVFGALAKKFGLGFTVGHEPWHIELLNAALAKVSGFKGIPRVTADGLGGTLHAIVQGGLDKTRHAANAKLRGAYEAMFAGQGPGWDANRPGGKGALSKGRIADLWRQIGGDPAMTNIMAAIALAESSGNPAANGPPDGRGLWQIEWPIWGRKMRSLGFGNPYDPVENAKMARHVLSMQGLGAWVVYKTGAYRQYLQRGGFAEFLGEADTGLPPRDDGYPSQDTNMVSGGSNDGSPSSGSGSGSKRGKRGRANRRRRRLPHGLSLLGRRSKRDRKKLRNMVRREINKIKGKVQAPFAHDDIFLARDPITGDVADVTTAKILQPLVKGSGKLNEQLIPFLEQMAFEHGRGEAETDTVTLEDTHQYKDMSNWLRSNPQLIPSGWSIDQIVEEMGSLTVDNTRQPLGGPYKPMWGDGLSVQGKHVPGIGQAMVKIQDQMRAHGAIYKNVQDQLLYILFGIGDKPDKAIKERRERLLMIKGMVERRITRKKKLDAKIRDAKKNNFTWRKAVHANEDLIAQWRKDKRDKNLPKSERRFVDGIIDHLVQTNRRLRRAKPKGTAAQGEHLRGLYYQRHATNESLRYLQGTARSQWVQPPEGGRAWSVYHSLDGWQKVKNHAVEAAADLKPIRTEQEQALKTLGDEYTRWSGSKSNIANLLATAKESRDKADRAAREAEIKGLLEQENQQLRMQMTHMRAQFDAMSGFQPLLAGRQIGSFARGGVIPETGMALVHKGEFINPAPDGPFRNGMNAAPQVVAGGPSQITLVIDGDMGALIRRVDARVDGRAAQVVSQAIGRRSRGLRAAPGG